MAAVHLLVRSCIQLRLKRHVPAMSTTAKIIDLATRDQAVAPMNRHALMITAIVTAPASVPLSFGVFLYILLLVMTQASSGKNAFQFLRLWTVRWRKLKMA